LNYGHTVGHGVELVSNYKLRHGEAVAIGMVIETQMAESIGLADNGLVQKIMRKLRSLGLPVKIPTSLDRELIVHAMKYDKKTLLRRVRFALPTRLGEVQVGIEVEGWEKYLYE
jgi:3-dehydroquinate synthetase